MSKGKNIHAKLDVLSINLSHLLISDISFFNTVFFTGFHVSDKVIIHNTVFNDIVNFSSSDFNSNANNDKKNQSHNMMLNQLAQPRFDIAKIKVQKDISFSDCGFPYLTIYDSEFKESCSFFSSQFNENLEFLRSNFKRGVSFHRSKMKGTLIMDEVITRGIRFDDAEFSEDLILNGVTILDEIYFQNAKLKNGVDLRRCNLDSLQYLFLEGIEFPNGKLYVDWDKIKFKDKPIITIDTSESKNNEDDLKRLENVYEILINNYEAQENKISSDDVRYELEVRRQEYLGKISHGLYGFFLGYGYRPFRYLIYLVVPVILVFAFIFYFFHYQNVYQLLKPSYAPNSRISNIKKGKYLNKKYTLADGYEKSINVPNIAVIWHCLFMSSSLLLGLRFKKDWINHKEKNFLMVASIEWFIGIGLYIGFALLVKTFRFEFLKGIFGF